MQLQRCVARDIDLLLREQVEQLFAVVEHVRVSAQAGRQIWLGSATELERDRVGRGRMGADRAREYLFCFKYKRERSLRHRTIPAPRVAGAGRS